MRYVAFDVLRQLDDLELRRAAGTADLEECRTPRIRLAGRDDVGLAPNAFAAVDVLEDDGIRVDLRRADVVLADGFEMVGDLRRDRQARVRHRESITWPSAVRDRSAQSHESRRSR